MTGCPEPVTGALVLNDDEELFLMRSPKWGGLWIVPGGHIERGETMRECVVREVKEETGLDVTNVRFLGADDGIDPPGFERETHFIYLNFVCRADDEDVELDGDEGIVYHWVRPETALTDWETNESTTRLLESYLLENGDE